MDLWKYYDGDLKYPNIINHSHEKEIAKTKSDWAYEYAKKHGKDEELEPIISTSSYHSYWYAYEVLDSRFELGEPAIAKDAYYSFYYALNILNGPFPLGEPAIASNAYYSQAYTNEVLKKDFYLDGKLIRKHKG